MKYLFEWDPSKDRKNQDKHGISFQKATAVLDDPLAISTFDSSHSGDEDRWITVGQVQPRTILVVIHTFKRLDRSKVLIRVISARRATRREMRQYEEAT